MFANTQRSARLHLRTTLGLLAVSAVLGGLAFLYLNYLTPQKLAVRHRLSEADSQSKNAIDQRLKPLAELFAKGRAGAKDFAERAVGWRGKWELMKGVTNGGATHRLFLSEAYESLVFSPDELRDAMEASVRAYMDDIEGFESEMLVKLRADLANPDRIDERLSEHMRSDDAFRQEYRKLADQMMAELKAGLAVTVGREVVVMVASTEATNIAMQAARAAATNMGISGGVLSTGAASTVATVGVGIVIAIIIDRIVDEILKLLGMDPSTNIEKLVCDSIDKLEEALIRDPGTFSFGKKGTLRLRMEEMHEARSKMRREAITRLLKEGGM